MQSGCSAGAAGSPAIYLMVSKRQGGNPAGVREEDPEDAAGRAVRGSGSVALANYTDFHIIE